MAEPQLDQLIPAEPRRKIGRRSNADIAREAQSKPQAPGAIRVFRNGALVEPEEYEIRFMKKFTRRACRMAERTLDRLDLIVQHSSNDSAVVRAAIEIFNRAFGTPPQHVNVKRTESNFAAELRALAELHKNQDAMIEAAPISPPDAAVD